MDRRKIENIIAICILTVFMGQIYISPFGFGFRLSFAVVALSLFLIYFKDYNAIIICTLIGLLMLLFRSFTSYFEMQNASVLKILLLYLPVLSFYIPYGILFNLLEVREKFYKPIPFMLSLWVCDSTPNLIEAVFRRAWIDSSFDKVVLTIILMGLLRTIFTFFVFWISHYYVNRFKTDQKEKYFKELILFTSRLKTELFFLKKSKSDIEQAMTLSHHLYETTTDFEVKPGLLKIATDIHEVKKDYSRVIEGMDATLSSDSIMQYMSIHDILLLIKDNAVKLSISQDKKIDIRVNQNFIYTTKEYYAVISILNNLVINAIEALNKYGTITVSSHYSADNIFLTVGDNGVGIDQDDIDSIFDAGYSTKYDPNTGNMSTGIGLTHVKQIVEDYFDGSINIFSQTGSGTEFSISIPSNKITEVKS